YPMLDSVATSAIVLPLSPRKKRSLLDPLGNERPVLDLFFDGASRVADVPARQPLSFVRLVALDRVDDAQVLGMHNLGIARGPDGHAEDAIGFRQPDQDLVAREADDAQVERVVGGAHLPHIVLLRKLQYIIGHLAEL